MKVSKEKYYAVSVFGISNTGKHVHGCHIIKAKTRSEALSIREEYGISHPWGEVGKFKIWCKEIDLKGKFAIENKAFLHRRRIGITGNIWYVDKNGNLQKETE